MMKPVKSKPLSPIMERHTPQHPLPEEIKNLPQDETVCQFCGVSYLIHHEIKRLEELVEELEKELNANRGAVAREEKLRFELEKNKNAVEYANQTIKQKDEVIAKITNDVEELKSSDAQLHLELSSEQQKRNSISNRFLLYKQKVISAFSKLQNEMQYLKSELVQMKTDSNQMKTQLEFSVDTVISKLPDFLKLREKEISLEENVVKKELEINLKKANAEICQWQEKAIKYEEEFIVLKDNFDQSGVTYDQNKAELKEKIRDLEEQCKDLRYNAKTSEARMKSVQANAALIEDKVRKKQSELQSVCVKLQKTEENAANTVQRITQDCRDLERQLINTKNELSKLKDAQKQKDEKEEELFKQAALHNCQIEEITKALAEAKASNRDLLEERNLMVMSHQHQIEQLRENFKKMLQERDDWTNAQKEIEIIERKHREALASMEKNLKSEFHIEIGVEKDKHSQAILNIKNQHRNEISELQSQHQTVLLPYKNQTAVLSQKLESLANSMQEKQHQCEEEKKTLKDLISHLESKIMELTGEHQDGATIKKLEIVAVNQKFEESLRENEKLQETVLSLQEEVNLLQDTVRRECEERFELTEALSQARQQLRERKTSNSLTKSNPVSALNKLNPHGIEAEPSNKLSTRTLRSLESEHSSPLPELVRNGQISSLRSLPDLSRPNPQLNHSGTSLHQDTVSTSITDISFAGKDSAPRRSSSSSSLNGHQSPGKTSTYNSGRKGLGHSESTETVDNVRKRIAAAIKRK